MDGLMVREAGVYELTESGRALWRVERFLRESYPESAARPRPVILSAPGGTI